MFDSFIYVILAIIALGFLIFIHELGHYFMARRVGMKVEAFGIGFGRPIYSWVRKGVHWRLNWLPFGGYVKIAGMELKKDEDPYVIPGGFFTKSPWDRIKVSLAGPLVNILFAFLIFFILWISGGREKSFSEFTTIIGWVDPKSELYEKGVRPGDEIVSYDGHKYQGVKDHFIIPMTSGDSVIVEGFKVNADTDEKIPFSYKVSPYTHPSAIDPDLLTSGILKPASFVIYKPPEKRFSSEQNVPDIQAGDRIIWMNGEKIYSLSQLKAMLNDSKVFLTIDRKGKILHKRVPRVPLKELKLDWEVREELTDWQYESGLTDKRLINLSYIPYNITYDGVVENPISFIDEEEKDKAFPETAFSSIEQPLKSNDRIIAVDGVPIKYGYQLFYQIQEPKVNVIVLRGETLPQKATWQELQNQFEPVQASKDLQKIAATIGTKNKMRSSGSVILLDPIFPKTQQDLLTSPEAQEQFERALEAKKEEIDQMVSSGNKERANKLLTEQLNAKLLGVEGVADVNVIYNPNPFEMFVDVTKEVWYSISSLVTGNIGLKWFSGPVGIVQAVQTSWKVSFLEALFWIGVISLNLGYLNLLPIPVLDGGYIVMFLVEMVTGKRIKAQSLEKLILPFVILLILFFLFMTYNDISRIFGTI